MTTERWIQIKDYEGLYSISTLGRVRSEARMVGHNRGGLKKQPEKILKAKCPNITGKGRKYPTVALWRNNKARHVRVHVLMAENFLGPKPAGQEILHGDDDPNNNALTNIRYGTHAENGADQLLNKTHCRSGKHPWTEENTYRRPDTGLRSCRACAYDRDVKRKTSMTNERNAP